MTVISHAYPSRGRSHVDAWLHEEARHLVAAGVRTRAITPQRLPAAHPPAARAETIDDVDVHRPLYPSVGARRPFRQRRLAWGHDRFASAAWRVACRLPPPTLYWGHQLRPSGACAVEFARRSGRPSFVVFGRGAYWDHDAVAGLEADRALLRDSTGVIALSEELAKVATDRYGVEPERVGHFPNAVDIQRFAPLDGGRVRRELGVPDDAFVVAFVGRFDENKGAARLAAALDLLAGRVFAMFLGTGSRRHRPLTRHPMRAGPVAHTLLARHLAAADVFVLPSLVDACPNAVLEAMACGLPVVVSDRPFARAMVDEDAAVFVDPTSPRAIANALTELRADPGRRIAMGQAARERAERYPLERRVREMLRWLDERVTAHRAP